MLQQFQLAIDDACTYTYVDGDVDVMCARFLLCLDSSCKHKPALTTDTAGPFSIRRGLLLPTVHWTIIISMASKVSDTTAVRVAIGEIPAANEDDSKRYRYQCHQFKSPSQAHAVCMQTAAACGRQQKQLWHSLGNYVTKQAANMMILLLPWSSCR